MRVKIFNSLIILILILSCAKEKLGNTNLTVLTYSREMVQSNNLLLGGIMFYGVKQKGEDYFSISFSNDEVIELKNGYWDFYAISWSGHTSSSSHTAMEEGLRCGLSRNIFLKGGEDFLTMDLNTSSCSNTFFGQELSKINGFPKRLKIFGCSNKKYFQGDDENCLRSIASSYSFYLEEINLNGTRNIGLAGRCFTDDTQNNTDIHPNKGGPIIPIIFSNKIRQPIGIRIYDDKYCQNLIREIKIDNLYREENREQLLAIFLPDKTTNNIYFYIPTCGYPEGENITPFSPDTNEYILCHKNQLKNFVKTNVRTLGASYSLGTSIDFKGDRLSGPVIEGIFTGRFDGQGYKIHNLNLASNSSTPTGIFEHIQGGISDVSLENIDLSCSSHVMGLGALSGRLGPSAFLENIQIQNVNITLDSCDNVGGLSGIVGGSNTSDLSIVSEIKASHVNINLDSNSNSIGGIIGFLQNYGAIQSAIVRDITFTNEGKGALSSKNFGGIIGKVIGPYSGLNNILATKISMGSSQAPLTSKDNVAFAIGANGDSLTAGGVFNSIKVKNSSMVVSSGEYHGGIVGFTNSGPLWNLIGDGIEITSEGRYVGGIVGSGVSNHANSTIANLRARGSITCTSDCGGIIGHLNKTTHDNILDKVYSHMSLTANGTNIGGVGGRIRGDISEVFYHDGTISGKGTNVGGIAGTVDIGSTVVNSLSSGKLSGSRNTAGLVGVMLGEIDSVYTTIFAELPHVLTYQDFALRPHTFSDLPTPLVSHCFLHTSQAHPSINGGCTKKTEAEFKNRKQLTGFSEQVWSDGDSSNFVTLSFYKTFKNTNSLFVLGTDLDPIIIFSPFQWNAISDRPLFMDKAFKLRNNLDFAGQEFVPLGSTRFPFGGILFGNQKTVSNITLDEIGVNKPLGLIRVTASSESRSASISSLTLENIFFTGDNNHIGALTGLARDYNDSNREEPLVIRDVVVTNSRLSLNSSDSSHCLGGLIGRLEINSSFSIITQLTSRDSKLDNTSECVGGIIGKVIPKETVLTNIECTLEGRDC